MLKLACLIVDGILTPKAPGQGLNYIKENLLIFRIAILTFLSNNLQELKYATIRNALLVLFFERVKQTKILSKLTKLEKSPTPHLATQLHQYHYTLTKLCILLTKSASPD